MAESSETSPAGTAPAPSSVSVCREPADLYALRSRRLIGRVAREFLDRNRLTPVELLHAPEIQQRYLNDGTTFQAAVQKAAIGQAQAVGQSIGQRVREIYDIVERAARDAAERLKTKPPVSIDATGFSDFVIASRQAELTETRDFAVHAALAVHLADAPSWMVKIDRVLALAGAADPAVRQPLDELLAEIVTSKAALRELLGQPDNLSQHLQALIGLLTAPQILRRSLPDGGERLRDALHSLDLGETRAALRRHLRNGIEVKLPLASGSSSADLEAHLALLDALTAAGDAVGGENTLILFGERIPRVLSAVTLAAALQNLPTVEDRIVQALDIHRRLGAMPGRLQVRQYVDSLFESARPLQSIAKEQAPIVNKLKRLTRLHQALIASGLTGEVLAKHTDPILALQSDLIRDSQLFENIEAKVPTPAGRAIALLDLCIDNAFIPGTNLRAAQQRVRRHMMHESFAASFLAGASDRQEQIQRLMGLQQKLSQSGFAAAGSA